MENLRLSSEMLENIVQRTLNELENGRAQIFQFAEAAREECTRVERVLEAVQFELQLTVENVEDLTTRFTTIRERLYEVNKEFHEYSEEKKENIYEEASKVREELAASRERERVLRVRHRELKQILTKFQQIAEKAERLVSQLGVALNYLSNDAEKVNDQLGTLQAREVVGQQILRSKELERKRMAGLLHDGPVQDLANLGIQLEVCEKLHKEGKHEEAIKRFAELKGIVQGSLGKLRHIIYDLNPMTLDDLGLAVTVKNFLVNLSNRTGINTEFNVLGKEVHLEPSIEMVLFRIIQESVQNSHKHANPNSVKVVLEYSSNFVLVEIKDDGEGFDLQAIKKKIRSGNHYGLLSMQSRLELIKGTFSIKSSLGEGTKTLVKVPLDNAIRRS